MISVKEKIEKGLENLSEPMLYRVLDFVEFLSWKSSDQKEEPLLTITGILSGEPISANDIEQELYDNE